MQHKCQAKLRAVNWTERWVHWVPWVVWTSRRDAFVFVLLVRGDIRDFERDTIFEHFIAHEAQECKGIGGLCWIIFVDNEPTRLAMKAGRARRNDWAGLIVRRLWQIRAEYDFDIEIRRVSSKLNMESDRFSRDEKLSVVCAWLERAGMGPLLQVYASEEIRNFFVKATDTAME